MNNYFILNLKYRKPGTNIRSICINIPKKSLRRAFFPPPPEWSGPDNPCARLLQYNDPVFVESACSVSTVRCAAWDTHRQ